MRGRLLAACVAGLAILTLGGCMRQSAYYYIQPNDTVDGTIYVALDEAYVDEADAYRGTGAGEVAAFFDNATITPFDNGKWKGYHVAFEDEPLASFAGVPTETWGVQIVKASNQYTVHGYAPKPSEDSTRQAIIDGDGFLRLTVSFPGTLVDQTESDEMSGATEKPGWASWDGTTVANAPYAKGNGGLLFHFVPGVYDLFLPSGDPDPNPSTSAAAPAPDPVVTVVITPSSAPSASPSASPSPTPSLIAAPESDSDSDSGIPVWIWIVGAVLLAAVVGLGSYLLATRKSAAAAVGSAPKPAPAGEPEPSVAPTKPTPTVTPESAPDAEPEASKDE